MKKLAKAVARAFGYEIRKIAPAPPSAVIRFLDTPEPELEFGTEPAPNRTAPAAPEARAEPSHGEPGRTMSLIVEGWRFIAHSYATVNQWQLLALLRRGNIDLKVMDVPLYGPRWRTQEGLFERESEEALKSLATADPDESADVTLRIFFPFDFAPSRSRRTAVFGTLEQQVIRKAQLADFRAFDRLQRRPPPSDLTVVTPSRWSAEGFYKSGFRTEQVIIVPHGVDTETFRPMPDLRRSILGALAIAESDFVFLSVGAMTSNKGIDLLLRAFAQILDDYPQARLVLKGMDPLYNSKDRLLRSMEKLSARDQTRVIGRTSYFGKSFPYRKMAMLYQAADCYVAPYRAEGFNIPVLEAAASGIPIICTRGGATDDFVTDAFARKIESKKLSLAVEYQSVSQLEPSIDHLVVLMKSAIEDNSWRRQAAEMGPLHARANYTWDHVVDTLVRELSN